MHNKKILAVCIFLSLCFCLTSALQAWGAPITVLKDNGCGCSEGTDECSIDKAINSGYNPIYVKPATNTACSYYNPITVTSNTEIIGLTSAGQQAWTTGSAGAVSGPTIKRKSPHDHIIKIQGAQNVSIAGFNIDGRGETVTSTALYGNVNYITLTYNTFKLGQKVSEAASKRNSARGVSVDNGANAYNVSVSYCTFTGQPTNTSNWFYVGNYGSGGSVGRVKLFNNTITDAMSTLQLSRPITNTQYLDNTFNNTWDTTAADSTLAAPYGYILIDEAGTESADNIIRGLTITHNTFNNHDSATSYKATNEFAADITEAVEAADANGANWEQNLALHANNFLQDDYGSLDYPIVGFKNASYSASSTNQISATTNYWGSGAANNSGPRLFSASGTDTTRADVSSYIRYDKTWSRGQISGGAYASVPANSFIQEITGTEILKSNMSLKVTTNSNGAATFVPTKYTSPPTGTSLPNAIAYYDLGIKSGGENIGAITATFYTSSAIQSPYVRFYNGSSWYDCSSFIRQVTPSKAYRVSDVSATFLPLTATAVTLVITSTASHIGHITPTLYAITRTSISTPTRTFFALVGAATSSTTTSTPSGSSTTTTSSSSTSSGTTTSSSSTSSSSTTTTTSSGGKTTTTTSRATTTTTTIATTPQLSVTPASLDFGDNDSAQQITIANTGTGTLTWQINDNETQYNEGTGWLFTASPQSGSVTNTPEEVTVLVNKRGLSTGTYSATLPVTSNGGSKDLGITMSVAQQEFPVVGIGTRLLLFFGTDVAEKTFNINNMFTGTLTWEIDTPVLHRGEGWLTVSPAAGYTRTETDTVKVTVDREGMGKGLYSATIPVKTNAGTINVIVMMLIQEGPVSKVQPSMLLYLNKTQTEKTLTITNTGSGILTWSIGTPEYHGGNGWVSSISPTSGSTETEPAEVTVTINREGLTPGLYRADILVKSNDRDRKVIVFLIVSPFS